MDLKFYDAYQQILNYCSAHRPPIPPPNVHTVGFGRNNYFQWSSTTGNLFAAAYEVCEESVTWRQLINGQWLPNQIHTEVFQMPPVDAEKIIDCAHQMKKIKGNLPWTYDFMKK